MKLFLRVFLACIMLVAGPFVWFDHNGLKLKRTIDPATIVVDKSLAVEAPLSVSSFFADESDDISNPASSNLRLFENGEELGPPHSMHDTIRANGRGAYSHWAHILWFSSSDGTSPLTNGRSYQAELVVYPNRKSKLIFVAIPIAALAIILAVRQLVALARKQLQNGKSLSTRMKLISQLQPTAREWVQLGGLTLMYGTVMFLITTSLNVQRNNAGEPRINFEYRVF
jgi:hypothetical protein